MDKEKFVQRVYRMLFEVCGCNQKESIEVLEECLRQTRSCNNFPRGLLKEANMDSVKRWADYVRTHPDKIWSRQQNILINSQIENADLAKLSREQYLGIKGELK